MSGPVDEVEVGASHPEPPVVEVLEPHAARVGEMTVARALPRRQRRTVGAWCFVDLFGPVDVDEPSGRSGMDIGPHPHMGLHTVTYLLDGQVLHRDSLGSEQVIRPGQVNLMTAGGGVSHAEEPTGHYRGRLQGVQLWVAQPERTRHGAPAFEHLAALPQVELGGAVGTVLVGSLGDAVSPARADTALVGAELRLPAGAVDLPLDPAYEHVVVVLDGVVLVEGRAVERTRSAYVGEGRSELGLASPEGARVLLLGGLPFGESLLMWWNYVGRTREEVSTANRQWAAGDERFGTVHSALPRIAPPPVPWS